MQRASGGGGERGVVHGPGRVARARARGQWRATTAAVGNLYGIVAFALLWLFLVSFFFTLFRALLRQSRRRRRGEGADWEHGL